MQEKIEKRQKQLVGKVAETERAGASEVSFFSRIFQIKRILNYVLSSSCITLLCALLLFRFCLLCFFSVGQGEKSCLPKFQLKIWGTPQR